MDKNAIKVRLNELFYEKKDFNSKIEDIKELINNEKFEYKGFIITLIATMALSNAAGIAQYGFNIVPILIAAGLSTGITLPLILHTRKKLKNHEKEMDDYSMKLHYTNERIESLSKELVNTQEYNHENTVSYTRSEEPTPEQTKFKVLRRVK